MVLLALALNALVFTTIFAQGRSDFWAGGLPLGFNYWLSARDSTNSTEIPILKVDSAENTVLNAKSGKSVIVGVANTPGVTLGGTDMAFSIAGGGVKYPVGVVVTPNVDLTPIAADILVNKINIVATAAPTAVYYHVPAATAAAGETFALYNMGASPANIQGTGSDTINALAAATPYAGCTTRKWCECTAVSNSSYVCTAQ